MWKGRSGCVRTSISSFECWRLEYHLPFCKIYTKMFIAVDAVQIGMGLIVEQPAWIVIESHFFIDTLYKSWVVLFKSHHRCIINIDLVIEIQWVSQWPYNGFLLSEHFISWSMVKCITVGILMNIIAFFSKAFLTPDCVQTVLPIMKPFRIRWKYIMIWTKPYVIVVFWRNASQPMRTFGPVILGHLPQKQGIRCSSPGG